MVFFSSKTIILSRSNINFFFVYPCCRLFLQSQLYQKRRRLETGCVQKALPSATSSKIQRRGALRCRQEKLGSRVDVAARGVQRKVALLGAKAHVQELLQLWRALDWPARCLGLCRRRRHAGRRNRCGAMVRRRDCRSRGRHSVLQRLPHAVKFNIEVLKAGVEQPLVLLSGTTRARRTSAVSTGRGEERGRGARGEGRAPVRASWCPASHRHCLPLPPTPPHTTCVRRK